METPLKPKRKRFQVWSVDDGDVRYGVGMKIVAARTMQDAVRMSGFSVPVHPDTGDLRQAKALEGVWADHEGVIESFHYEP